MFGRVTITLGIGPHV